MALDFAFTCPLPNGVHARPASAIEDVARRFAARVTITNERTGLNADAASVLGLVGLEIAQGDPCRLTVSGADERDAFDALVRFLQHDLPSSDDALPVLEQPVGALRLPRMLAGAGVNVHAATPVVAGIGIGRAVVSGGLVMPRHLVTGGVTDPEAEVARIDAALTSIARAYHAQIERFASGVPAEILKAQRAVSRDPEFRRRLHETVRAGGRTAAGAIADAEAHFGSRLAASQSARLRERALDVRDVCVRLFQEIYGASWAAGDPSDETTPAAPSPLDHDWVWMAESVTPGQFLAADRSRLRGLVLARGGLTSHTVILARSFGIPTLVGLSGVDVSAFDGRDVVVDAELGALVSPVTKAARRYYALEQARQNGRRHWLKQFARRPAMTADGRRLEVGANIGSAAEVVHAVAEGAEGIGVFRTEMLFQGRPEPPSEEEQFAEYRTAVEAAGGRPVIIRTLDVGGDKPMPYLRLPAEENPFLGYRAIRLYPEFEGLFRSQVRALVRASAFGNLKVMLPMITSVDEVVWARRIVAEEQAAAVAAGHACDPAMAIGAMIEVPAAAFLMDHLCRRVDFFSIGTNDLLQYSMAADRANASVAALYDPRHPAFLRLLRTIVGAARAGGRWVGLCGEMGGQIEYLPLLVGLGLDEISMGAPRIAAARAALAGLPVTACVQLLDQAVQCATVAEVSALLAVRDRVDASPLFDPDLVAFDVEAASKEEAIKTAVDRLYVAGRTDRPREIEDLVWAREAACSTGFGHGFAIPHAKTDAVRSASLVFVRLREPVDWGSIDAQPVTTLVLLTLPASDAAEAHLRILATLSRRLMHEEFRDRLRRATDAAAIGAALREA